MNYNNNYEYNTSWDDGVRAPDSSTGFTYNDLVDNDSDNPFIGAVPAASENELFVRVLKWLSIGLGISTLFAYVGFQAIYSHTISINIVWIALIAEFILVLFLSHNILNMSATTAKICFAAYSAVNGFTLSVVLLVYAGSTVFSALISTAVMFGIAALFGKTTQKDLTNLGSLLIMGLFGIIVMSLISMIINIGPFDAIISIIGIVIFVGLTAFDVQKLKYFAKNVGLYDEEHIDKVVIYSALQIYLDFVNIFLRLIRLTGKRRN